MVGQTHEVHLFLGAGSQALQHLFKDRNQAIALHKNQKKESFVTVLLNQIITITLCQGNYQSGLYIPIIYSFVFNPPTTLV